MKLKTLTTLSLLWGYAITGIAIASSSFYLVPPFTFISEDSVNKSMGQLSKIECAAYVHLEAALGFEYNGTGCHLVATGVRSHSGQRGHYFAKYDPPGPLEEVARDTAVTYTSSVFSFFFEGAKAVDSDLISYFASSPFDDSPFWIADLLSEKTIYKIMVKPTIYHSYEKFSNVEIRTNDGNANNAEIANGGNCSSWPLVGFYKGPYSFTQGTLTLFANGLRARYICIWRVIDHIFQIEFEDVQVMATAD